MKTSTNKITALIVVVIAMTTLILILALLPNAAGAENEPAVVVLSNAPQQKPTCELVADKSDFVYAEEIPLSEELQRYTYDICGEYGVDYYLALAVMKAESNFDSTAISYTDDYGLMQINVCHHEEYGETYNITDFLNPKDNIFVGVHILSRLSGRFDTDREVVMAYKLGATGAAEAMANGQLTTPEVERIMEYRQYMYILANK